MKIMLAEPLLHDYLPDLERATGMAHDWHVVHSVEARDELADVEVLIAMDLPARVAVTAQRLRLVQVPGAGYEGIAVHALPHDVTVANTSHHGRSVAEYVVTAILTLNRGLRAADRELRGGRWLSRRYVPGHQVPDTLLERTAGVIGLGEIGADVVHLLTGLGMRCVAIRRHPERTPDLPLDLDWFGGVDRLPELCAEADVIVVTAPLTADTAGILGAAQFALMKRDALLINVARGPIIDETALYTALAEHRIRAAALDAWWRYPDPDGNGAPSAYHSPNWTTS